MERRLPSSPRSDTRTGVCAAPACIQAPCLQKGAEISCEFAGVMQTAGSRGQLAIALWAISIVRVSWRPSPLSPFLQRCLPSGMGLALPQALPAAQSRGSERRPGAHCAGLARNFWCRQDSACRAPARAMEGDLDALSPRLPTGPGDKLRQPSPSGSRRRRDLLLARLYGDDSSALRLGDMFTCVAQCRANGRTWSGAGKGRDYTAKGVSGVCWREA